MSDLCSRAGIKHDASSIGVDLFVVSGTTVSTTNIFKVAGISSSTGSSEIGSELRVSFVFSSLGIRLDRRCSRTYIRAAVAGALKHTGDLAVSVLSLRSRLISRLNGVREILAYFIVAERVLGSVVLGFTGVCTGVVSICGCVNDSRSTACCGDRGS